MGRSVVRAALRHNDRVCAVGQSHTSDTPESMRSLHLPPSSDIPSQEACRRLQNYLPLLCDVRVRSTVSTALQLSLAHFGSIDIIANFAGYGIIGACEDQSEADMRNQFETNFMGTLSIIQLSLPYFREQHGGRYVIFNSMSGALGVPGLGPYCATKYAVEGLIESMLYEVDAFGIKATLVVGGLMRTDGLPDEAAQVPKDTHLRTHRETGSSAEPHRKLFPHFHVKPASGPYASATSPADHFKHMLQLIGDNQPSSATKSAELIWQLGHCSFPPLRLCLGRYAVESLQDRLRSIVEEIEDWKHLGFATGEVDMEAQGEMNGAGGEGEEERDGFEEISMEDRGNIARAM